MIDLEHRRVYLPQAQDPGGHDVRALVLQTLGHVVLGHTVPRHYGDFLRQRVETNYFSAALLMPERRSIDLLRRGAAARDVAIEDLRDAFAVSYETAAHRFTNLATRHLGIQVHFMRVHESGTIYKAYENDGVHFPADVTGRDRGPAGLPPVDGAAGLRAGGQVRDLRASTPTRPAGRTGARR